MTDPVSLCISVVLKPIMDFITSTIMVILKLLLEVCISPAIWNFVQSKLHKIPRYIRLLLYIYNTEKQGSEVHQKVTIALLLLSSILSVIVGNFLIISIPIVGILTEAIALLAAFAIILGTMEILLRNFGDDYFSCVKDINIKEDIQEVKRLLGPTWEKLIKQLEKTFDDVAPKVEANFQQISEYLESYFKVNLRDLYFFINPLDGTEIVFTKSNIKKIGKGLESWEKAIISLAEGGVTAGVVGVGTASIANAVFVQSTIWTSLLSTLGINTGIAVSASAFTLLTVGFPVTLASAAAAGAVYHGFKQRCANEAEKESDFFSSTILAMLPIAYADGLFCQKEKDTIHQVMHNQRILDQDHEIIYQAIEADKYKSFDQICRDNILLKVGHPNATIQHTLLLFSAWELAKIDGVIHPKEFELFERMAFILKVDPKIYRKIQTLVTPEAMMTGNSFTASVNLSRDYIPLVCVMDDFID